MTKNGQDLAILGQISGAESKHFESEAPSIFNIFYQITAEGFYDPYKLSRVNLINDQDSAILGQISGAESKYFKNEDPSIFNIF